MYNFMTGGWTLASFISRGFRTIQGSRVYKESGLRPEHAYLEWESSPWSLVYQSIAIRFINH